MKTETKTTDKDISVMQGRAMRYTNGETFYPVIITDDAGAQYLCKCERQEDAAYICEAVNGYDKLLEENTRLKSDLQFSPYREALTKFMALEDENKRLREALQDALSLVNRVHGYNPDSFKIADWNKYTSLKQVLNNNINLQK